jgi:hypothetical protein
MHIIQGTNDKLIPFKSSIKLSEINQDSTTLCSISGGPKNRNTVTYCYKILTQIINDHDVVVYLATTSIQLKHSYK